MTELLTSAQMRAIEQAAITSKNVTGLALMERAGRGVVDAVFQEWPELAQTPQNAVVLCGPGNNGGDGFVIARRLNDMGWQVEVRLFGDPEKLPPDAQRMYVLWSQSGATLPMDPEAAGQGEKPALMIDAMFGTGLTRPIPLACARTFQAVRNRKGAAARCVVVAVDCPSGMDCDSGATLYPALEDADDHDAHLEVEGLPRHLDCDLCVTFHRAKVGHYLTTVGAKRRPVVVDIGLPEGAEVTDPAASLGLIRDPERVRLICPPRDAAPRSLALWLSHVAFGVFRGTPHKYDRGHALVLGGGTGKGGAGRLAARAALRSGAGLVTLGVPPEALAENAAQLTAIMLQAIGGASDLTAALADNRITALCLGPGLGVGPATRDMVRAALAASDIGFGNGFGEKRRYVLDADALTSFAQDPEALFEQLHENCVLTPHEGEFARLFPDLRESVRGADVSKPPLSKVEAVRAASKRAGCTILLKGAAEVIASPNGTASIHAALYDRSAPWLGTAGAGDVLAGIITGLMASPVAPSHIHQIVEAAAYLHVEAARAFGPGLIAEDLPDCLPQVYRRIGLD